MNEAQFEQAVITQWKTGWATLHASDCPYTLTNEAFGPTTANWARLWIDYTTSEQATQGSAPNRKFHRRGNVFVQLFGSLDVGTSALAALADDVRATLEGFRTLDANLYAGRTERMPDDGVWAMRVVVVPFRYVSTR